MTSGYAKAIPTPTTGTGNLVLSTNAALAGPSISNTQFVICTNAATTDNTTIAAAFASVSTHGAGSIYLTSNCTISQYFILPSNVQIHGNGYTITGAAASQWSGSTVPYFFVGSGSTLNVLIEGVRFVCDTTSGNASHIIQATVGDSDWNIDNNVSGVQGTSVANGCGNFLADVGGTNIKTQGNHAYNWTNACLDHWDGATGAEDHGNFCSNLAGYSGNNSAALQFTGCGVGCAAGVNTNLYIADDNIIILNDAKNGQGININGFASCGSSYGQRISIHDNIIINASSAPHWGILASDCVQNIEIHHNYCEQTGSTTGYSCVSAQSPSANVKIDNNIAINWQATSAQWIFSNNATNGTLYFNDCLTFNGGTCASTLVGTVSATVAQFGNGAASTGLNYGPVAATSLTSQPTVAATTDAGNVGYTLSQSGIPFILAQCTINASGALSSCTTLPATYANAYMYFQASTLASSGPGSTAGFYFVQMSSTTAGTAYLNEYVAGSPTIPGSPTAVTAAAAGTVNPGTGAITCYTTTLPANALGPDGELDVDLQTQQTSSSGTKAITITLNGVNLDTTTLTTVTNTLLKVRSRNVGEAHQTVSVLTSQPTSTTIVPGNVGHLAINTGASQTLYIGTTLNTPATDYQVFEGYSMKIFPN